MEYRRRRLSVPEYISGAETNRPCELDRGVVREPAAPSWNHQVVAGRIFVRLESHIRRHALGQIVQSPVDVVLDRERALVVQPDVVFVSNERLDICTDRIWGAPDLVVEVLSFGTARHDSTAKLSWYREYGVRECWLVDPASCRVGVNGLSATACSSQVFGGTERIRSGVLPQLQMRAVELFS